MGPKEPANIANDWQAAEEQTIEVFEDIRRNSSSYDPSRGSVVGWIAQKARATALRHRPTASPEKLYGLLGEMILLRDAVKELTSEELQVIETAFFAESNC